MDADDYCRELEAHLCRRNAGHLVRLVGPSFDLVRRWASSGIPLKVAQQGIDRFIDRAQTKGPRRRPIRIEFCEADVLEAFDAWRRAVGVRADLGIDETAAGELAADGETDGADADAGLSRRGRARESLSTHLDRVIVRLTALRAGGIAPAWDAVLDETVRALDAIHPASRRARGDARDRLLAELAAIDARLIDAAYHAAPPEVVAAAKREADVELEPFRGRLSAEAYESARRRSADRLLRNALPLPILAFE